jgi:hypothetical protein
VDVQPHGEDSQVAPAREEVLSLTGSGNARGRRLRGVDWLNWPCGQNPGRKPEGGRRRASAREAMSLGEQSSTCRASTLQGLPERLNSAARVRTHVVADERELDYSALLILV